MARQRYEMHAGNRVGESDDAKFCIASSEEEAMQKAIAWADLHWPDSGARYSAVVWVERGGEVVAQEDVEIDAAGRRVR